ncbi:nicotinic acetylcholine receptor, invertebrate [Mytilus galloprovincialis]|uniref:Nicotinic acetylcholine receptor, invertebrate n=1 Tax=Mytilus galloprovincialis TaxID=29158 RepID=A0A8B6G8X7_MYTGA|nr:nicotinic acetylcholine receptor, invertebrate [Mytilus galloprovincialis]
MTSKGFFTERGIFIFLCFLDLFKYSTSYSVSDANHLHNLLFDQSGYKTLVLPAYPVIVSVEYNMLTVNSLDMKSQALSTSGWFTVVWNDSRLAWNKSSHDNIENIYVTEDVVWHPKLIVQNSIDDLSSPGDGTTVRIRNDGEIRWELPAILSTSCDMDVTNFPFDSQTCDIELASWGFHTDAVNLTFLKTNLDLEDYNVNGEWNIVSTSQHASKLTDEGLVYSELLFRIVFERLPNYYIMSVIIPVILTAVLTSVTFILPVESGEKVGYILTVLLALAVLLTLFTDSMPTTSKHTSVLVVFLTVTLGMASFVIIVTILIIRLYHEPENYIAPTWMHSLVRRFRKPQNSAVDANQIDQTEFTENNKLPGSGHRSCKKVSLDNIKTTYTNIELALFFDNFLFVVFTVLYVLITVCFALTLCVAE